MTCIIEHARVASSRNAGKHVRHHGPQPRPGRALTRAHAGEMRAASVDQRRDPRVPYIPVIAVELRRARAAEPCGARAAGDNLGAVVQQTDPRRRALIRLFRQIDGDGISLDRLDIDPDAERMGQRARQHAAADDNLVEATNLCLVNEPSCVGSVQRDVIVTATWSAAGALNRCGRLRYCGRVLPPTTRIPHAFRHLRDHGGPGHRTSANARRDVHVSVPDHDV